MIGEVAPATLVTLIGVLLLAGAMIGVLAGLFGVGGGAISVPVFRLGATVCALAQPECAHLTGNFARWRPFKVGRHGPRLGRFA